MEVKIKTRAGMDLRFLPPISVLISALLRPSPSLSSSPILLQGWQWIEGKWGPTLPCLVWTKDEGHEMGMKVKIKTCARIEGRMLRRGKGRELTTTNQRISDDLNPSLIRRYSVAKLFRDGLASDQRQISSIVNFSTLISDDIYLSPNLSQSSDILYLSLNYDRITNDKIHRKAIVTKWRLRFGDGFIVVAKFNAHSNQRQIYPSLIRRKKEKKF